MQCYVYGGTIPPFIPADAAMLDFGQKIRQRDLTFPPTIIPGKVVSEGRKGGANVVICRSPQCPWSCTDPSLSQGEASARLLRWVAAADLSHCALLGTVAFLESLLRIKTRSAS